MNRYLARALIMLLIAGLYVQIFVIRGFNTETFASKGYSVRLMPESEQRFGGLAWGLLRFDLDDKFYVGIVAHIGANQDAIIRLEKDGKILTVRCRSDQSGTCWAAIHRNDVKMSGKFRVSVMREGHSDWIYDGSFDRQDRPVFLLREALLSV